MSLQTPNQSMQMYCSVTTLPPSEPREDISSLQHSSSEHQDCIRLLEMYIFIIWQGSLEVDPSVLTDSSLVGILPYESFLFLSHSYLLCRNAVEKESKLEFKRNQ